MYGGYELEAEDSRCGSSNKQEENVKVAHGREKHVKSRLYWNTFSNFVWAWRHIRRFVLLVLKCTTYSSTEGIG